ncbi:MAG: DUF3579 domain-containing protein [Pseudomonadota bacterium]
MSNAKVSKIIIKGVTTDGRRFRPSDWAQRLTTAISTIGPDRRVHFHPKVNMVTIDGVNCVVIDASLEEDEPTVFKFLLNFAKSNNLETYTE